MQRTQQDRAPRENPIVDQPATVAACNDDRANAQGHAAATNQLADARTQGNDQAGTR